MFGKLLGTSLTEPFLDADGSMMGDLDDLDQDLAILDEDGEENNEDEEQEENEESEEGEEDEEESEDEDEDEDDKGKKKSKKKDDDETEEEEEEEEEEEDEDKKKKKKDGEEDEEDEEDNQDETVKGRPTIKQLKDAGVLKKFPGMREIYFRDNKMSQIFTDPDEANEALEKAQEYDNIESKMLEGDPSPILEGLHKHNPAAFKMVAENFLEKVRGLDRNVYIEATEPVIVELLNQAVTYGTKQKNNNLVLAAKHISNFVYANGGEIPKVKGAGERHPAEIELENKRKEDDQRDMDVALNDVNERLGRKLTEYASEKLPKELSKFERRSIIRETLDDLSDKLRTDQSFQLRMRNLWRKAGISRYSEGSKVAITNAHTTRARSLIRDIRNKKIEEALGTLPKGKKGERGDEDKRKSRKRNIGSSGRRGVSSGRKSGGYVDPDKIDYANTSDDDILSGDSDRIRLKGQK